MKTSTLAFVAASALSVSLALAPARGTAAAPAQPAVGVASPKPAAEPAAAPAPAAIPMERVFRAADELEVLLRKAEAAGSDDGAMEEVERQLESAALTARELRPRLEPQLLKEASPREIDRLRQALAREDLVLAEGQARLEKRAEAVAEAAREAQFRRQSWQLTSEAARRTQAPPAVLQRATQVVEQLEGLEARLREREGRIFGLQGRVSDQRAELARGGAALDEADAALARQLFEVESAQLWRVLARPDRSLSLGGQVQRALRETREDAAAFLAEEPERIGIHLVFVLALGLALRALRRPVEAMGAEDPALRNAARVLSRPWSAALLLSLALAGGFYQPLAPALKDLFAVAFLVPLLRLLPWLVPGRLRRPIFGLVALFALDRLAAMAPPHGLLARVVVLLVGAGALAGLLNGLRRGGWIRHRGAGGWELAGKAAATAAIGLFAVAVVANVVGNATLAERLTHATLASATAGAALMGLQAVLEGALAALLHIPGVKRRPLVARHGALVERRAFGLLRIGAVVAWGWSTLLAFGLAPALAGVGESVLGLRLQVGGLDVSLGNVVAFGVTLALALALSRAVRFLLDEGVFLEVDLPRGVPAAISTTVQYTLVILGFSWAVLASGMEVSRFSFLVGALGVGIGFGLQNVVNNVVSGLILLYERPVQAGDIVEVGTVAGTVTRIGVRSSTVRTFAGAEVIVPNASLISTEVTNWTLSDKRRRIELAVGVAYGTAPDRVIQLLLATVEGRAGVLETPAPAALLIRFGESSIDFVLRFWTGDFDQWQQLASDVMVEVYGGLGRAGIQIPFPQRDLHVRSLPPEAAPALAGGKGEAERPG